MKHFKINAVFEEMFKHLKTNIEKKDKQKVCILHTTQKGEQDIYLSTEDEIIIDLMKEKFDLEPCSSPVGLQKESPDKWMARGNPAILLIED